MRKLFAILSFSLLLAACDGGSTPTTESKDAAHVQRQQSQYAKAQPVPGYEWSLERHLLSRLYDIRNEAVVTHSVWRGDFSVIEGDCPSYGFGLPYDTSLTNPLVATDVDNQGEEHHSRTAGISSLTSIEQPEPNGVFASKNTAATWVFCLAEGGMLAPVYVETKVTVYPGPMNVDYETNRVTPSGASTILISLSDVKAGPPKTAAPPVQ